MSMENGGPDLGWAPSACTLPTAEQPLRVAEFDELFARSVRAIGLDGRTLMRLELEPTPEIAAAAAGLMAQESRCCSYFEFTLTSTGDRLTLSVCVPPAHAEVLDGLAVRARAGMAR